MNIPSSTYRIQLRPDFTFDALAGVLEYLRDLGISHIYASPILAARKGSTHGYDVVDPTVINPELGGDERFELLAEQVRLHGLEWIQDIVPNHMAFDSRNAYLMDVLERGARSSYRDYFDIEWEHPDENLRGRVLAPFLQEFYGTCLDRGIFDWPSAMAAFLSSTAISCFP